MNTMSEPVAFIVKQADISALFSEMGLTCNEGSDFYRAQAGPVPDTDIRAVYGALLADRDFLQACRIIAQPDLYVTVRTAGVRGLSETRLHRKKAEGDWAVLTETAEDGGILISAFEDYRAYLEVWAEDLATPADAPAANYIPPTVSLEEFLFVLHAVDSFRRVSYQNMLDHVFTDRAHIKIPEFTRSMADSLKSLDIRWLLPAFMAVTPGVEGYQTDLNAKNLEVLLTHDFFEQGKLASGEGALVFGEAGQVMGVEFLHSWLLSCGLEINAAGPEGFKAVERLFIAPTVLTNHFVRLQGAPDGKATVNHQAYTAEQLLSKLDELFGKAFAIDVSAASPALKTAQAAAIFSAPKDSEKSGSFPIQAKAAATPPAPKFCRNCGAKLPAGAAFCANCGAKLS
ncbi:MAG: zinc ribbon domain-containing protein [Clostridiales bacterium]